MAVERATTTAAVIHRAEVDGAGVEAMIDAVADLLPSRPVMGPRDADRIGVPAVSNDWDGPWIQLDPTTPTEDALNLLVLWRLGAAVTKRTLEAVRAEQLNLLSAGELVAQILDSHNPPTQALEHRARSFGIAIESWHVAVRLEFDNLFQLVFGDEIVLYEQNEELCRLAAHAVRNQPSNWTLAPRPAGALLIRTSARPAGSTDHRQIGVEVRGILTRLHERLPQLVVYCGVGSGHQGVLGMRATVAEADSALESARLRAEPNELSFFDAPGIRRLLLEWYSSASVRDGIEELLAPLSELGDESKQRDYLQTLRVYLDHNRSIAKCAEDLYIHRNTVSYRVARITELLDVDLDDPSLRLALHLACRAKALTP
jgi:sugar diacid utilization regulator